MTSIDNLGRVRTFKNINPFCSRVTSVSDAGICHDCSSSTLHFTAPAGTCDGGGMSKAYFYLSSWVDGGVVVLNPVTDKHNYKI